MWSAQVPAGSLGQVGEGAVAEAMRPIVRSLGRGGRWLLGGAGRRRGGAAGTPTLLVRVLGLAGQRPGFFRLDILVRRHAVRGNDSN